MELMAGIDEVVEKMEQQLKKYKTKVQDRHRGPGLRQMEASEESAESTDSESTEAEAGS
jgi:ribosome-associated translation inhibitor RaiA